MPEVYFELLGDAFDPDAALTGSPLLEFAEIQRKGENTGMKSMAVESFVRLIGVCPVVAWR